MSVPRARLLDLMKVQCRVFATTFNPEGIRTGNKILRQRIKGPALMSYYPPRVVDMKELRKEFGPQIIPDDEAEDFRQESLAGLRSRGKLPKRKRGTPDPKAKRR